MTKTLPLQPQEEARLIAVAQVKGVSTEILVRQALDKFLPTHRISRSEA